MLKKGIWMFMRRREEVFPLLYEWEVEWGEKPLFLREVWEEPDILILTFNSLKRPGNPNAFSFATQRCLQAFRSHHPLKCKHIAPVIAILLSLNYLYCKLLFRA